jgi:cobalamin biosynthesis protein CobT
MAFSVNAQEVGYTSAARFIAADRDTRVKFDAVGCAPHATGLLEGDKVHELHLGVCPVLPSDVDNMLLTTACWHEALHIRYSCGLKKSEFPQGSLHTIMNSLEDNRIERYGAEDFAGVGPMMRDSSSYYNKKIGAQISTGEVKAPLWEAVCAMDMMERGLSLSWVLTPKAKLYVDAAYDLYCGIRKITREDGVRAVLELAKEIQKKLIDVNKDLEKEPKPEPKSGKPGKGEKGEGKPSKGEKGEAKPGAAGDIEDETEKPEEGEGEEGAGEEAEEGEKKDGKSSGKSEEKGEEKDGKGSAEGESKEGEKKASEEKSKGGKGKGKKEDKEADEKAAAKLDEEAKGGKDKKDAICEDVQKSIDKLSPAERDYVPDRSHDRIETVEKRGNDDERYREALREVSGKVAVMGSVIEQALRAAAKSRVRTNREVGDLDENNLVAAARGLTKAVFKDVVEGAKLNTVVSFVIDESGSMRYNGRVEKTRLVVMALGEVLARFGIPFEVLGSTTTEEYNDGEYDKSGFTRTNPLWMRVYKGFNETWVAARAKVMQTSARNNNIDGEWVEFAGRRIAGRKERRKIVFSLSDGSPVSGHGCAVDNGPMTKNVKNVCARLRKSGIEVYGFGIETDAPKALYGDKFFIGLEDANKMGEKFVREFAAILSRGAIKV